MNTTGAKAKQITLRLEDDVYERLDVAATRSQRSVGFIIRACVHKGLPKWEGERPEVQPARKRSGPHRR